MSDLGDIYAAMATVIDGVSSVAVAYTKPPEVAPKDANLPAAFPQLPSGEIQWGASHDSRDHVIRWTVLVTRGDNLTTAFDAVIPVLEAILTAFQTNQRLGLSYVYSCVPTGYEITGFSFLTESYIGAELSFTVKQKRAVTFS